MVDARGEGPGLKPPPTQLCFPHHAVAKSAKERGNCGRKIRDPRCQNHHPSNSRKSQLCRNQLLNPTAQSIAKSVEPNMSFPRACTQRRETLSIVTTGEQIPSTPHPENQCSSILKASQVRVPCVTFSEMSPGIDNVFRLLP